MTTQAKQVTTTQRMIATAKGLDGRPTGRKIFRALEQNYQTSISLNPSAKYLHEVWKLLESAFGNADDTVRDFGGEDANAVYPESEDFRAGRLIWPNAFASTLDMLLDEGKLPHNDEKLSHHTRRWFEQHWHKAEFLQLLELRAADVPPTEQKAPIKPDFDDGSIDVDSFDASQEQLAVEQPIGGVCNPTQAQAIMRTHDLHQRADAAERASVSAEEFRFGKIWTFADGSSINQPHLDVPYFRAFFPGQNPTRPLPLPSAPPTPDELALSDAQRRIVELEAELKQVRETLEERDRQLELATVDAERFAEAVAAEVGVRIEQAVNQAREAIRDRQASERALRDARSELLDRNQTIDAIRQVLSYEKA